MRRQRHSRLDCRHRGPRGLRIGGQPGRRRRPKPAARPQGPGRILRRRRRRLDPRQLRRLRSGDRLRRRLRHRGDRHPDLRIRRRRSDRMRVGARRRARRLPHRDRTAATAAGPSADRRRRRPQSRRGPGITKRPAEAADDNPSPPPGRLPLRLQRARLALPLQARRQALPALHLAARLQRRRSAGTRSASSRSTPPATATRPPPASPSASAEVGDAQAVELEDEDRVRPAFGPGGLVVLGGDPDHLAERRPWRPALARRVVPAPATARRRCGRRARG